MVVRKKVVLSFFLVLIGVLGAFGQPIAGVLYEHRMIFLGLFVVRESWLFFAAVILLLVLARVRNNKELDTCSLLVLTTYIVFAVFVLLIALSERTPSLMIVFLQFRNLFGFALAIVLVHSIYAHLDRNILFKAGTYIAIGVVIYTYLEFAVLLKYGYLISNEYFNKELLEQAKGTRSAVSGGILGAFRIPGPLFNPSQLGVFTAYAIYAGTSGVKRFSNLLVIMLLGVVILGFSKSAFVMIFVLILLKLFGRQVALVALLCFLFAPLLLEVLSGVLPDYHLASISRHFDGYVSAIRNLWEYPIGSGVGSAGELATTLGGFEAKAGFESGMGTIMTNLGLFGLSFYAVIGLFCFLQANRLYFDLFALWSVSMYFNESALSPHLFVFQACMAASLVDLNKKISTSPGITSTPHYQRIWG